MLEVDSFECLFLDGITDEVSLSHGQRMAASEHDLGLFTVLVHIA